MTWSVGIPKCLALLLLSSLASSCLAGEAMTPNAVDRTMAQGYAAIKVKDYQGAKAAFLSVIKNSPASPRVPDALLRLGHLQLKGESQEALKTLSSLTERYPDSQEAITALHRIGSLDMRYHRYDDAQKAF